MTTIDLAGNRISSLDGLDGMKVLEEVWVRIILFKLLQYITVEKLFTSHSNLIF